MQYFKNIELAKLYPVSESAVRKWIDSTRQGKLNLQLYEHNGKFHIANTSKNVRLIEELVARGQKYKNTRGKKIISPKPEFYEIYNKKQILDIISNIENYGEIPMQYNYFNGGAVTWDNYSKRLWNEEEKNLLNSTVSLLSSNFGSIDSLIEGYERVNVIDLGVGNCLPVKEFLTHLLYDRAVLGRYIAIDLSGRLLDIAEKNIRDWFGDKIHFEKYERDFSQDRFDDIVVEETLKEHSSKTLNVILLLGGTLANFKSPDDVLRPIRNSMGRHDLLITSGKLDTSESRRYFDFNAGQAIPKMPDIFRSAIDLLNIDESFYDVEQGYNDKRRVRYMRLRLNVDLDIEFQFNTGKRKVELYKGYTLLPWRYWHQTTLDFINQLDRNGFTPLQASATKDRQYLLTVSEIAGSQLGV